MKPALIVIVDDNTQIRGILMHAISHRGFLAWTCPGNSMALSIFAQLQPSIVVLDLDLEQTNALQLLQAWKKSNPSTRILVKTRLPADERKKLALQAGADAFVESAVGLGAILEFVEHHASAPPQAA